MDATCLVGKQTIIMGVLNATPDSFYDGGVHVNAPAAVSHGRRMVEEGAHIIDVGGESSRPGAAPVHPHVEQERVVPVVHALAARGILVSVDTYHASTAQRAVEAGARMINDISAFRGDPQMAEVAASAGVHCVLMHMQGTPQTMQKDPQYDDVVDDLKAFFEDRVQAAISAGVSEDKIWLDPGFGFGKTPEHNIELLRRLSEFRALGFPLLIGTSNKSTIGKILDLPVHERDEGTAATVSVSICNGADAVRVHNVKHMARTARMTDAVVRQTGGEEQRDG